MRVRNYWCHSLSRAQKFCRFNVQNFYQVLMMKILQITSYLWKGERDIFCKKSLLSRWKRPHWGIILSIKKKNTTQKLRVKIYLGWNQDLSPGDSISGSPAKLLEEARGEARIYTSFCNKEKVVGTKDLQITRFTEENLWKFLWEDRKVQACWNHSFDMRLRCGTGFVSFLSPTGLTAPALGVAIPTCDTFCLLH